jgi:hypothetical protein
MKLEDLPPVMEIENRTRQIVRFPMVSVDKSVLAVDHKKDLVIGSKRDAELPKGIEHGPLCPKPTVKITRDELAAYGSRNLDVLLAMVDLEQLRVRPLAA